MRSAEGGNHSAGALDRGVEIKFVSKLNLFMFKNLITFTTFLAISAIGLLFFPSRMLAVVGIISNPQADFLLQTTGARVAALLPGTWALRTAADSPLARAVPSPVLLSGCFWELSFLFSCAKKRHDRVATVVTESI